MKLAGRQIDAFLRKPDPAVRAVLVYGPDAGLARERADALARHVVEDLGDPFRVVELAPDTLKDDPARLVDEATALSFGGGERVVRLRQFSDAHADVLIDFLDRGLSDCALVVVEAGDLGGRSRLRRAFEGAAHGAALPCYRDEGAALERVIEDTLAARGVSAEPAALQFLVHSLGGDRLTTRGELDKLMTFVGEGKRVTLADVEACVGDAAVVAAENAAHAAASGDFATLERSLRRAYLEGIGPIVVLRAVMRHLALLHRVCAAMAQGNSAAGAVGKLRPPPFYKLRDALAAQAPRWTVPRLCTAMSLVTDAEAACKTTGAPDEALCGRALMQVASAARRR